MEAKEKKMQKISNIRQIGIGFDEPGEADIYSDGGPCKGLPPGSEGLKKSATYKEIMSSRRRINPNPAAGEIRKRELKGLWMQAPLCETEQENAKARGVLEEKRVFGLAKQAVGGLATINVRFEMTTVANLVRLAYRYRTLRAEAQDQGQPPAQHLAQKLSAQKIQEMEHANEVLDAVLQYNMYKLAELLGCPVRKPKTFGIAPQQEEK
mmetsp:Transcript_22087/g.28590  ORF Transcript_22087/g.28590 Transcript_22087/m.28590 type:complete len:209 (+) Transcript_22087:153-779(+)